jgi:hypothetical protein
MDNLNEVPKRHKRDRWKDAVFIAGAVLLTAVAIGSVTNRGGPLWAGKAPHHTYSLTVIEDPGLLNQ